ncbi:hypothetical protein MTR_2g084255 [Medicago truncatula]|uniref:Uncharacterized protein n=1 Tax=Medicago truncatula TaxID=3880 RepID=A0A072VAU7_MEDTR|nr:hypothetical protein MTR_2g084255 [Medicago truncatula]
MTRRRWEDDGAAWEWRRRLLAWEEKLVIECSSLMCAIVLQDHVIDRWCWTLDPINGYSVKGTYQFLTLPDTSMERGLYDAAWLKQVSLKGLSVAWYLFHLSRLCQCSSTSVWSHGRVTAIYTFLFQSDLACLRVDCLEGNKQHDLKRQSRRLGTTI